jgi:4-amino-4-deoxy-L-arabinose transferase-like glycosyltransferase
MLSWRRLTPTHARARVRSFRVLILISILILIMILILILILILYNPDDIVPCGCVCHSLCLKPMLTSCSHL